MKKHYRCNFRSSGVPVSEGLWKIYIYKPSFPLKKLSILRETKQYENHGPWDHELVNILRPILGSEA